MGWFLFGVLIPDIWSLWRIWRRRTWYRFKIRQLARAAATRHAAAVAHALWTGSTSAYQFLPELPRVDNSTEIDWERRDL